MSREGEGWLTIPATVNVTTASSDGLVILDHGSCEFDRVLVPADFIARAKAAGVPMLPVPDLEHPIGPASDYMQQRAAAISDRKHNQEDADEALRR